MLLLDPTYGEYAHVAENVVGCCIDRLTLRPDNGFGVDIAQLEDRRVPGAVRCDKPERDCLQINVQGLCTQRPPCGIPLRLSRSGGPTARAFISRCRSRQLFLRDASATAPGLDNRWFRIAVKDAETNLRMAEIISRSLS